MSNVSSSFVSLLEQIALQSKNSVEIIAKFNEALNKDSSVVNINILNEDGSTTVYQMPTVGFLKSQIDIANSNIKRLSGIDSSTFITDGKTSKKVFTVDLNREPYPIGEIGDITKFTQSSNWFFESLMNPLLSVKIDLSNSLPTGISRILSRRYVIKFEENQDGLTTAGQTSLNSFTNTFLNRTDITVNELESWISNPTNIGVISNTYLPAMIDEEIFDLSIKELNYKGTFSVMKIENDAINNKVWYHLNTLTYHGKDKSINKLSEGDELIVNRVNSSTKYRIKEISTASQLNRICVERLEGYDPIPVGTNVLEYYSSLAQNSNVKVSIGYNEYNVIFVKPINDNGDIISSTWSNGTAFYTSDLILDTDTNTNLVDFYYRYVSDFGAILKDFVTQKLPTSIGIPPNKPTLDSSNFKVVQINQHLTDTTDSIEVKKLHAQKSNIKSKLDQTNNAILEKNKEISTKNFKNIAEKNKAQNELENLSKTQESQTKMYSSIVSQISATKTITKEDGKFRVRGFWEFPEPQTKIGYRPQEIIGFYIEYRYSNKSGKQPNTEGFKLSKSSAGTFDGTTSSDVSKKSISQPISSKKAVSSVETAPVSSTSTATSITKTTSKTAYFSQWIPLYTDIRKRTKDVDSGLWYWAIEDISDADTPNINQLDIPIKQNEKVEIRIKSISEVGYPDSKLMSDFSDILTIEFPDNLNNILDDNQFILKEATMEETLLQFESNLNSKGLNKHLSDQFYIGETYVAHNISSLVTTKKDPVTGDALMADEYIYSLQDRIAQLEEAIKRPRGQLQVTLFRGTTDYVLKNNSDITINVECEDYGVLSGNTPRVFLNDIYIIKDFYLRFKNVSAYNPLGLFSDRLYDATYTDNTFYKNTNNQAVFVDIDNNVYTQSNNQFIWFSDNVGTTDDSKIYYSLSAATDASTYPFKEIFNSNRNFGGSGTGYNGNNTLSIIEIMKSGYTYESYPSTVGSPFAATIHPVIPTYSDIIDTGQDLEMWLEPNEYFDIPINIYFMFNYSGNTVYTQPAYNTSLTQISKKLRVFLDMDGQSRPYQSTITFNLKKNRVSVLPNFVTPPINNEFA